MNLDNLSPELREKAKSCTSAEELLALAKSEGIELSDEDLQGIAGGWSDCESRSCARVCPFNANPI